MKKVVMILGILFSFSGCKPTPTHTFKTGECIQVIDSLNIFCKITQVGEHSLICLDLYNNEHLVVNKNFSGIHIIDCFNWFNTKGVK